MENKNSEEINVKSDSASKLRAGLEMVEERAREAAEAWEQKKKDFGTKYMCNTCRKTFSSIAGVKRHFSSKSSTCKEEKGYSEVSEAVPTAEDKTAFATTTNTVAVGKEVTKELRESAKTASSSNGKRITVVDLVRCPTPMLESMLKKAETSEIKKFVSMRFHPANASRKFIAQKELDKR